MRRTEKCLVLNGIEVAKCVLTLLHLYLQGKGRKSSPLAASVAEAQQATASPGGEKFR